MTFFINHLPQIVWIALTIFGLVWTSSRHGEPSQINAIAQFWGVLVANVILWWGGFYG